MKCPECNTYYADMLSHCPNCGAPTPRRQRPQTTDTHPATDAPKKEPRPASRTTEDHPQLGKGMMAFIIIGLLALIAFFTVQYMVHRDDPEYFRTLIEPDTTLADRDEVRFEKAPIDTAAAAKEEEEAKRAAENMYKSIRHEAEPEEPAEETPAETAPETENATPAETAPAAEPAAPAPKVEAIE